MICKCTELSGYRYSITAMTVEELELKFVYPEKTQQFYQPGDVLEGVVIAYLRAGLRTKGVFVHLDGKATVSWEARHKKKSYSTEETHLNTTTSLLDVTNDHSKFLPKGLHEFGFKVQLPTNLPSTFNGVYGGVTYVAKITVEGEDNRNTATAHEPFMVLRRPHLDRSFFQEKKLKKSKFYLGFTSGKVTVECSIEASAAIPGRNIIVSAEVANWTNKKVRLIQAAFVQESRYFVNDKEVVFRHYLSKRDDHYDVNFLRGRRWRRVSLPVPPFLPDSGLEMSKIIQVDYLFQFKVVIEDKKDIILETPLYITHPLEHDLGYDDGAKDLLMDRLWQDMALMENISLPQQNNGQNKSNISSNSMKTAFNLTPSLAPRIVNRPNFTTPKTFSLDLVY